MSVVVEAASVVAAVGAVATLAVVAAAAAAVAGTTSAVSPKFVEKQPRVLRLRLAHNTRQSPLRMTVCFN
jgi:hypothetical protein